MSSERRNVIWARVFALAVGLLSACELLRSPTEVPSRIGPSHRTEGWPLAYHVVPGPKPIFPTAPAEQHERHSWRNLTIDLGVLTVLLLATVGIAGRFPTTATIACIVAPCLWVSSRATIGEFLLAGCAGVAAFRLHRRQRLRFGTGDLLIATTLIGVALAIFRNEAALLADGLRSILLPTSLRDRSPLAKGFVMVGTGCLAYSAMRLFARRKTTSVQPVAGSCFEPVRWHFARSSDSGQENQ